MAQNTVLGHSSFDRERRRKDSIESHALVTGVEEASNPIMELALDSRGRELESKAGCQTIESSRYVQKDGLDLISDIEHLHPSWESRSILIRLLCLNDIQHHFSCTLCSFGKVQGEYVIQ